jgi:hypothetical protein
MTCASARACALSRCRAVATGPGMTHLEAPVATTRILFAAHARALPRRDGATNLFGFCATITAKIMSNQRKVNIQTALCTFLSKEDRALRGRCHCRDADSCDFCRTQPHSCSFLSRIGALTWSSRSSMGKN